MSRTKGEGSPSMGLKALHPVTRGESRAHQAYELLRHELLFGPLRDVDRLVENELAKRYQMSRTPVREALQRLALGGFVSALANGGFVRRRLTRRDIREIFEVRRLLEDYAVQSLARSRRPGALAAAELEAENADGHGQTHRFHARLIEVSGNRTLVRLWQWLNDLLTSYELLTTKSEQETRVLPSHESVILAVRENNAGVASECIRKHLAEAEAQFLRMMEPFVPMRQRIQQALVRLPEEGSELPTRTRRSLSDATYQEVRSAILDGRLGAGQPIVEASAGAHLGISRTPVRRALQRLELEGYLEREPSGRLVVHLPSIEEVTEIYAMRELIEGYAARLAGERISDRELSELEILMEQDREAQKRGSIERLAQINRRFHGLVIMASRNRTLHELAVDLRDRLYGGLTAFAVRGPRDRAEFVEEHGMILAFLDQKEPEQVEQLVRRHIAKSRERSIADLHSQQLASSAVTKSAG